MLWWAERDPEFLVSLAPSTVKLLSPEVIALFPAEVLAELDAAQAEAEAVSAAAPPLPETWAGPDSPFQTSADLLNNPFGLSAADLLNVTIERNPESIGDLTPDVILWLGEQDASFLTNCKPVRCGFSPLKPSLRGRRGS
jgi:hypothetical protein